MPRKSIAALAVVPGLQRLERLRPPRSLTPEQRTHFAAIVAGKPADYFQAVDVPLLVAVARHLALADVIAGKLADATDVDELDRLAAMHARETGRITSLMTRLRCTPQARYKPDAPRLQDRPGRAPWEPIEE